MLHVPKITTPSSRRLTSFRGIQDLLQGSTTPALGGALYLLILQPKQILLLQFRAAGTAHPANGGSWASNISTTAQAE